MKNAKSGWTNTCLCFIYPQGEKLLKRLRLIGKWDLVGQEHLKLQLLTFPSRTSLRVRIDVWIVFVLLLITSGWKCLSKHFTGGFRICFPSLQLKGSRRCHSPYNMLWFLWLWKNTTKVSLDPFFSNTLVFLWNSYRKHGLEQEVLLLPAHDFKTIAKWLSDILK